MHFHCKYVNKGVQRGNVLISHFRQIKMGISSFFYRVHQFLHIFVDFTIIGLISQIPFYD